MNNFSNSNKLSKLIDIGISLSKEKNINILLEKILNEARVLSNSDGGTVYLISNENQKLSFKIMQTESLDIRFGGSAEPVPDYIYPVKLYNEDGTKNLNNVSAVCALTGKTINIKDAYENDNYDFSGVKGFDKKHNYYSKSFLNVPLKDHKDKVIGVLQLLNPKKDGDIISFTDELVELVEALSSQASVALTNQLLIEEQKILFRSFIKLVAEALEHKDAVTGGHCNRVPVLTMMFAECINADKTDNYKDFSFTEDEMDELFVAGWLHDFGKVATPDHIMNKSTKLEGLYDKIDQIKLRFEILKRDVELNFYKNKLSSSDIDKKLLNEQLKKIDDDFKFLEVSNVGGEFMSEELQNRVHDIAKQKIELNNGILSWSLIWTIVVFLGAAWS